MHVLLSFDGAALSPVVLSAVANRDPFHTAVRPVERPWKSPPGSSGRREGEAPAEPDMERGPPYANGADREPGQEDCIGLMRLRLMDGIKFAPTSPSHTVNPILNFNTERARLSCKLLVLSLKSRPDLKCCVDPKC